MCTERFSKDVSYREYTQKNTHKNTHIHTHTLPITRLNNSTLKLKKNAHTEYTNTHINLHITYISEIQERWVKKAGGNFPGKQKNAEKGEEMSEGGKGEGEG